MDAITCLQTRVSVPLLTDPGPSAAQLDELIKAGLRAPDHMRLTPWRFLVVQGDARLKLGDLMVDSALCQDPNRDAAELEKIRNKPLRAPTILVVVTRLSDHPKVPKVEQRISAGAAATNIVNAAFALNIGAMWRTGGAAYSEPVKQGLGLSAEEEIAGFIYLGTPNTSLKPVPPYQVEDYLEYF